MNFKVYPKKEDQNQYFKLKENNGRIELVAVDKDGNYYLPAGTVLALSKNGIILYPNVNPKLYLPLDHEGRVKVIHRDGWMYNRSE